MDKICEALEEAESLLNLGLSKPSKVSPNKELLSLTVLSTELNLMVVSQENSLQLKIRNTTIFELKWVESGIGWLVFLLFYE